MAVGVGFVKSSKKLNKRDSQGFFIAQINIFPGQCSSFLTGVLISIIGASSHFGLLSGPVSISPALYMFDELYMGV